ncbi:hypothetical protein PR048_003330 [Dryococelus australis]|uniref:Uncharacterized protein n=1 Tax=Dryococelus australis TaxID=614101 RepID=A0ABQ9IP78_9NEOP|nr:hypothetical protein PR048_003330 [Dryococelus australis]
MQRQGKREIIYKTSRPTASSSMIPMCGNLGVPPPRIKHWTPCWEASKKGEEYEGIRERVKERKKTRVEEERELGKARKDRGLALVQVTPVLFRWIKMTKVGKFTPVSLGLCPVESLHCFGEKLLLCDYGEKGVKEEIKWQVIGMRKCSKSYTVIAGRLGISITSVEQTIHKHMKSTTVADLPWSCRLKITNPKRTEQ